MLISGFLFAGVTIIFLILFFATSLVLIASSIALICFISKQKRLITENVIQENNVKKIRLMGIFSILTSVFSCLGLVVSVLPIISIVMCGKINTILNAGEFDKAKKRARTALTLLMISNITTLTLVVLNLYSGGDLVMIPLMMIVGAN